MGSAGRAQLRIAHGVGVDGEEVEAEDELEAEERDLAVGETVILLHPPSPFSRRVDRDEEGASVK